MDLKKAKWEYDCDGREIEYPAEMERSLKEYYDKALSGVEKSEASPGKAKKQISGRGLTKK